MDSPGSDKGSDDSDSQSSNVSSPGMGSPRRVRKEGSPLSASWDTPLSGRSLLKESLIAAESRSNGGFGSPLEHPPGRIQPGGLRLSYDRLLGSGSDSPLGTPKIAKGRERHVDSPKDSPSVSHDFSFSPGGVGSRHAPLMGSPLGMGLSSGGRDSDTMSPLGVTVFKREALHEGDPLIRHGSIKKLGLSIAIPDGTTDQDPPAPKAYETSPRGDVSKATASPLASPTRPKAVAGSPKDKPLSPFADKLSYGAHNPPSSFSTGLTLPTLTRVSSHKARAKVAPEPLRISDEVVRPEDHISGQRVSGDKRAARKDHVMQAIDGDGSKALSGLDSLTMLSRKVGGVKKAGYGESSHEGDVSGEAVTEVVKSKPANSSPWRPLEQGPGGVKPLAAATPKKAKPPQEDADVHTATGQSRNGQDGADVSQEAKVRQLEGPHRSRLMQERLYNEKTCQRRRQSYAMIAPPISATFMRALGKSAKRMLLMT